MRMMRAMPVALVAVILMMMTCSVSFAGPKSYKADLYINFQFERTIRITFDPEIRGNQRVRIFEGSATVASAPPTPLGGEEVNLIEEEEGRWSFKRPEAIRSVTIKRVEEGKLTMFYFTRGSNVAEGELKAIN